MNWINSWWRQTKDGFGIYSCFWSIWRSNKGCDTSTRFFALSRQYCCARSVSSPDAWLPEFGFWWIHWEYGIERSAIGFEMGLWEYWKFCRKQRSNYDIWCKFRWVLTKEFLWFKLLKNSTETITQEVHLFMPKLLTRIHENALNERIVSAIHLIAGIYLKATTANWCKIV